MSYQKMDMLNKKISERTVIVFLKGFISTVDGSRLADHLDGVTSAYNNVILNLREVTFISTPGLGAFIQAHKIMRETKKNFLIVSIPKFALKAFALLKLSDYFRVFDSEEHAIGFLKEQNTL